MRDYEEIRNFLYFLKEILTEDRLVLCIENKNTHEYMKDYFQLNTAISNKKILL